MQWNHRRQVATRQSIAELMELTPPARIELGFGDTLGEIWQQPELWRETANQILTEQPSWQDLVISAESIVLTGSGSSYFVGKSAAPSLQRRLSKPVIALESGEILLEGAGLLPPVRPLLVVSFARSGDSPESWGVVQHLLETEARIHHLLITCNPKGRLARTWGEGGAAPDPRVRTIVLDERACDRSLVMTSSFTSMLVAALGLCALGPEQRAAYLQMAEIAANSVSQFLDDGYAPLEDFAFEDSDTLFTVGSGSLNGAAHEVALKVLEMSDGRIMTRAETSLGLRHGPMCGLGPRTPLFLPLSSGPLHRAYQLDLLADIEAKRLECRKILIGADIPPGLAGAGDTVLSFDALRGLDDEWLALAGVVVGQLLAFLGCLHCGLRPDHPPARDSISRVVGGFTLHNLLDGSLR